MILTILPAPNMKAVSRKIFPLLHVERFVFLYLATNEGILAILDARCYVERYHMR